MGADDKSSEGEASMISARIDAGQGIQLLTSIVPESDRSRHG